MVRCQIYKARFLNIYGDLQMKKSLIALAALASVATVAQAQSSVTIYGIVDAALVSVTGASATGKVQGMGNGGLSTPRLGFRGTEDLGGGLKANFHLEAEFLADTGSQSSTPEALFARRSTVGLEGNFGRFDLGRMDTLSYSQVAGFDGMGGNNIGGLVATGSHGQTRVENSITYVTPRISGVQLGLQTGTRTSSTTATYGEIAGEASGNRVNTASVGYVGGNLELAAHVSSMNDAAGEKMNDYQGAFARYNFGILKATVGYMNNEIKRTAATASTTASANTSTAVTASGSNNEINKTFAAVSVPYGNWEFRGQYEQIQYKNIAAADQEPKVYSLGALYSLSKRTTLYAVYSQSNADGTKSQEIVNSGKLAGFSGTVASTDKKASAIGIRHTF
jgi:predicted porin